MTAKIHLIGGDIINLDEFATENLINAIKNQEVGSTLNVLNFMTDEGKMQFSVPMSSVTYIKYEN